MDKLDKKKRQVSGSRSVLMQQNKKSKKSKPNDASIDLKPKMGIQAGNSHEHSKVKTQNSLNKSKGSKKGSKYPHKTKLLKSTKIDESKEISRSVSAERKHSLVKMNRTEANFEAEDIERRIYTFKKAIKKIEKPDNISAKKIHRFYREIQDSIEMVSEPLYSLLCCLHQIYMSPIAQILDMISPYQHLLQRKDQLSKQVEEQVRHNEEIYSKLTEQDIYIIKLKETIQEQRQLIEQKKKEQKKKDTTNRQQPQIPTQTQTPANPNNNQAMTNNNPNPNLNQNPNMNMNMNMNNGNNFHQEDVSMFKNEGLVRNMRKDKEKTEYSIIEKDKDKSREKETKSIMSFKDNWKQEEAERDSPGLFNKNKKEQIVAKTPSLKLDLGGMNKNQAVGFHDEFYSKIDEFSESWRNQALKEKRF